MNSIPGRFFYFWEQPTDVEAFERHYREVHIPLARKLPGLRSYAITDNPGPVRGQPYYRIAELRWDTAEEMQAAFASPEGHACADDVEKLTQYTTARGMVLGPSEEML
jgi:uncharacterized protein (TIGR02118 family)